MLSVLKEKEMTEQIDKVREKIRNYIVLYRAEEFSEDQVTERIISLIEQAKQEMAKEIFEEIELSDFYDGEDDAGISVEKPIWERLKSCFLGKKEIIYGGFHLCGRCMKPVKNGEQCPDCLDNKGEGE